MSSSPRPPPPPPTAGQERLQSAPETAPQTVANLEFKARLLMLFMVLLVCVSALYVLYARGAFENTQRLVLMAEDSEGVVDRKSTRLNSSHSSPSRMPSSA